MARSLEPSARPASAAPVGDCRWSARFRPISCVSLRPASGRRTSSSSPGLIFGQKLLDPDAARACAGRVRRSSACSLASSTSSTMCADREADRRHPVKSRRPVASGALPARTAIGAAVVLTAGGLGTRLLARSEVRPRGGDLCRPARSVFRVAQARRDHGRADDCLGIRAARHRRRRRDRRGVQRLAPAPDTARRLVSGFEQAARRTGDAGRRRHRASPDSGGIQPVPAGSDDRRGDGLDVARLCLLHDQSGNGGQVRHRRISCTRSRFRSTASFDTCTLSTSGKAEAIRPSCWSPTGRCSPAWDYGR